MRALLLVVFAVAGGVAGWQLRGLAANSASAVAMPIASMQQQARSAPIPSRQAPPETAVLSAAKKIDSRSLALVTGDALEVLYEELAQADLTREETIRPRILQYVSEHRARLIEQQRWTELLDFYQRLVSLDPHFSEHYYRLAEVQVRLQLYDQALYSLYFILQDAVMGARARALEQSINKRLQFNEGVTVPLLKHGIHHVVEARLPSGALRLLLDTGASITTLTPNAARRLNLSVDSGRSISLATAGGLVSAPIIEVSGFTVGAARVERLQVGILPLVGNDGFDGLLGMNFLQQFASSINQQDGVLHLQNKG
jgi:clan AA aspartic protease (TIGR02281 family)